MQTNDPRSVSELVSDAVNEFTKLISNETAIARAELSAKATEAVIGIGLIVGGAVLLIPALVLLLMALAAWFAELGMSLWLAHLLAAVVGIVVAAVVAYIGKSRLTPENLKPRHTLREVERDIAAIKERS